MNNRYQCIALPRRGGKILHALETGKPIFVPDEITKRIILRSARIMGVRPPEIIVLTPKEERLRGVTLAGAIVDYP